LGEKITGHCIEMLNLMAIANASRLSTLTALSGAADQSDLTHQLQPQRIFQ
jgi:hypothetical protein